MTNKRENWIANSNNSQNPEKNICGLRVAEYLGIENNKRFIHITQDLIRAARKDYLVRSRKSSLKCSTVAELRKSIAKKGDAMYYILRTPGHVCLLDGNGRTLVDTAPSYTEKQTPDLVYGVYPKVEK